MSYLISEIWKRKMSLFVPISLSFYISLPYMETNLPIVYMQFWSVYFLVVRHLAVVVPRIEQLYQ